MSLEKKGKKTNKKETFITSCSGLSPSPVSTTHGLNELPFRNHTGAAKKKKRKKKDEQSQS